jgi:hypothetical protein
VRPSALRGGLAKVSCKSANSNQLRLANKQSWPLCAYGTNLFDRRFELFNSARTFLIQDVYPQMNPTSDAIFIFTRNTATAAFLVGRPLREYLEELRTSAFKLQKLSALVALQHGPDHADNVQTKYKLVEWFAAQHEVLVAKFQPFLNLDFTTPNADFQ